MDAGVLARLFECATGLPIAQIARSAGRPDQNYFARRFKFHSA